MHFHLSIIVISTLALPFLSAQPTSKDANTKKPCVVPAIAYTAFDYVFSLTATNHTEHTVDNKPLRLLRTPNSAEVTPFIGDAGDLVDFGFRDGHLSIIGGRLAYDLPTIEIFPPVLVPWRLDLNVQPRGFTASYACDKRGNQILVLKPDGAEGFAVRRTKDAKQEVLIRPRGYIGDAIDVQFIVNAHSYDLSVREAIKSPDDKTLKSESVRTAE
ncbi:MAG: hypothetical protein M1830_004593 [Pleopsidium flavum]|nr:MAG: hypothetical protein M1830_004593 [Pleopsidium flavum]